MSVKGWWILLTEEIIAHKEKTYTKDFLSKNKSVQISTLLHSKVINYKGQAINLIGAFYIEKDHQNVDP